MLADVGTTWTKFLDENGNYHVIQTKQVLKEKWKFKKATGHLAKQHSKHFINELEALGYGALKHISEKNFTIIDVGSRDTKFLKFKNRKVHKLDWNQSCGASTGFTLELLLKYYELQPENIIIDEQPANPITCAVFGMEQIFDSMIKGSKIEIVMGQFIKGLAYNVYEFSLKPDQIYLSGGLSENSAFIKALSSYAPCTPLGRFVLLDGLK